MKRPSRTAAEHFARSEYERLKSIEAEKQNKLDDDERRKAQELHYMHCPKCGMSLIEIEYKSIWVDKCSGCEGVWLDTGEMESVAQLDNGGLDRLFGVFRKQG